MSEINLGSRGGMTPIRVLLVDDNEGIRRLLSKQLETMDCIVEASVNASDFLGKLAVSKDKFDMAIVDLRLPDLNGDQIISWLNDSELEHVKSMPILIVTGYPQDVPEALVAGQSKIVVLSKPYHLAELKNVVDRLVPGKNLTRH